MVAYPNLTWLREPHQGGGRARQSKAAQEIRRRWRAGWASAPFVAALMLSSFVSLFSFSADSATLRTWSSSCGANMHRRVVTTSVPTCTTSRSASAAFGTSTTPAHASGARKAQHTRRRVRLARGKQRGGPTFKDGDGLLTLALALLEDEGQGDGRGTLPSKKGE